MIVEPFSAWWCCLNPRERSAITQLTVAFFANEEYITQEGYTFVAFTSGLASFSKLNEYFIQHYGLTSGIILDEEGLPVSVFFFDPELWSALLDFAFTDAYICANPCKLLTFSA